MCGGGGGGAEEANQVQQDQFEESQVTDWAQYTNNLNIQAGKEAGIEKNIGLINDLFGGLSFDEFGNAVFDLNKDALQENFSNSSDELGFRLARAGLGGGSVDVDTHSEMEDTYDESIQQAQSYADNLVSGLQNQASGLQTSLSGLAASGAPISGSSVMSQIGGLSSNAPTLDPALQNAFVGIYEDIGTMLGQNGGGGVIPGGGAPEFSSFSPTNPNKNVTGQLIG